MTTKTARKPRTRFDLSRGAEAVRRHLAETGDSIAAQIAGPDLYWSLTKSGLPLRGCDVRELKAAGVIVAYGGEIDPKGPAACYVLAGREAGVAVPIGTRIKPAPEYAAVCASGEPGQTSIAECKAGICLKCAPRTMVERIRKGEQPLPKTWIGARP
jgi:hypothetical protein